MIVFKNVTKQFGEDSFAVQDVSFEINPGELVVITGPSGSGKTTLMRLLTREYSPSEGEIFFQSTPLSSIKSGKLHHHRRQIGVVFQDYKLLNDLNVYENIALALEIIGAKQFQIEERVTDLLELIQLTNKAFLFPSQLSGGEAQRVSIARALATAPSVIFADEPTGNLDPTTSLSITRLLQKIHELGTTVLVSTHDVGVLKQLDKERHMKLEKGKLIHDSGAKVTPQAPKPETKPVVEVKVPIEPKEPKKTRRFSLESVWPFQKKKVETAPTEPAETKVEPITPTKPAPDTPPKTEKKSKVIVEIESV